MELILGGKELQYYETFTITENLDRTLNTIVMVDWDFISQSEPIAPKTPLIVKNYNNKSYYYVVNSDVVEIASRKPLKYKHTITFVEGISELNNILVRNSTFVQREKEKKIAEMRLPSFIMYDSETNQWQENVAISSINSSGDKVAIGYSPFFSLTEKHKQLRIYFESKTTIFDTRDGTNYSHSATQNTWIDNAIKLFYLYILKINGRGASINASFISIIITQEDILKGYHELTTTELEELYANVTNETTLIMSFYNITNDLFTYAIKCDTSKLPTITPQNLKNGLNPLGLTFIGIKLVSVRAKYTLYDVLSTLLEQSKQTYNNESRKILNVEISDELKQNLQVNAPDFSFTGKSLFECITEILNYIDAIPRLYYENDKVVLNAYFVNDNEKSEIEGLTNNIADTTRMLTDKGYNNRLVNQYQKGTQKHSIFYPSKGAFKRISSSQVGVFDLNNSIFDVGYPIERIDSLKVKYSSQLLLGFRFYPLTDYSGLYTNEDANYENVFPYFGNDIDITRALYEDNAFNLLPTYNADWTFPNVNNTLSYKKGGKNIDLHGASNIRGATSQTTTHLEWAIKMSLIVEFGCYVFGKFRTLSNQQEPDNNAISISGVPNENSDDWITNVYYQVEYHQSTDGQAMQESTNNKYNGEEYINQSNGQIVLEKLGINTKGLISQLGNATINMVVAFNAPIELGMWFIDTNGNRYVANSIQTQWLSKGVYLNGGYEKYAIKNIQFTKDFNSLSTFVNIDSTKRFYDISSNITTKGYQNLIEYVYFSFEQPTQEYTSALNTNALKSLIGQSDYKVDFATLTIYENVEDTENLNYGYINDLNVSESPVNFVDSYDKYNSIEIPLHAYGYGNSICFETAFDSDIKGGTRISNVDDKRVVRNVIYTNQDGYFAKCDLKFTSDSGSYYENWDFPLTNKGQAESTNLISIKNFHCFKRPSEIFTLNFQVAFLPLNCECYFGSAFINDNNILRGGNKPSWKIYQSNKLVSILDDSIPSNSVLCSGITTTFTQINPTCIKVAIQWQNENIENQKSLIIANEDKNILFAFNKDLNEQGIVFYVFTSRFRL